MRCAVQAGYLGAFETGAPGPHLLELLPACFLGLLYLNLVGFLGLVQLCLELREQTLVGVQRLSVFLQFQFEGLVLH